MKSTLMIILSVASLLFCIVELSGVAVWSLGRSLAGVIEYPEKRLIALCLASATALLAAVTIHRERACSRWLRVVAWWVSVLVGLGVLLTKAAVAMISADSDIHQWHLICAGCGALLLAMAATQHQERH